MLEEKELRRPNYMYELRFETINKEAFVDFDFDSINNFTSELEPNKIRDISFACQDFYDKGGRFLCRNSTRLPDVPMADVLHCLVFAPQVSIYGNHAPELELLPNYSLDIDEIAPTKKSTYFAKIVCDNGELVLPLTHILTHTDLEIA